MRISGCGINAATQLMHHLPEVLPVPLYKHQAQRLGRELGKVQTLADLIPYTQLGDLDQKKSTRQSSD